LAPTLKGEKGVKSETVTKRLSITMWPYLH